MKTNHYVLISVCTCLTLIFSITWYGVLQYQKLHPSYDDICSDYNMSRVFLRLARHGRGADVDYMIRKTQQEYNIKGHYSGYINTDYGTPICHINSNHRAFNTQRLPQYDTRDLFVYYNPVDEIWEMVPNAYNNSINCECGAYKPDCRAESVKPCIAKILNLGGTLSVAAALCECEEPEKH